MKTALVTGASRGIGKAVALLLAKQGYTVGVNYLKNRAAALRTVTEILSSGGDASELPFDVGDFLQVKSGIEAFVSKYKRLDVLVLNAGISHFGLLDDVSEEEYEAVMRTNLKGAYNCVKAAAPYMTGAGQRQHSGGFFRMGGNGRFLRGCLLRFQSGSRRMSRLLPRNTLLRSARQLR